MWNINIINSYIRCLKQIFNILETEFERFIVNASFPQSAWSEAFVRKTFCLFTRSSMTYSCFF